MIPQELCDRPQWCVAGPDKAPLTTGAGGKLRNAKVTVPSDWLDYSTARGLAELHGLALGFVLSHADPYCCIDLDVTDAESQQRKGEPVDPTKWTTQDELNRYYNIVRTYNSYTESSLHGKGVHIWVRGKLEQGYRRDGVEVYPHDRFIICTGRAIIDAPIEDRQDLLLATVQHMTGAQGRIELSDFDATEPDEIIWARATEAVNGDKFKALCAGDWKAMGYPSQSEADNALMSIFTFYSKSNEQCRRMFRQTVLGQREKAVKDDRYLNYTLRGIRARQAREEQVAAHGEQIGRELLARHDLIQAMQEEAARKREANKNVPQPAPSNVQLAQLRPLPPLTEGDLPWPPGLVGAVAGYIYRAAMRPIREVSIVAALGLMAGICGRQYNIPASGLNVYIILVARSGIGKEAMHSGISYLMSAVSKLAPSFSRHVDFSDFVSAPALMKAVAANPCFVNVSGEWGRKLRRLSDDSRLDGPVQQIRTVMTNLYQKSGQRSIVGGLSYSKKDDSTQAIEGAAYSMIGETTPSTFFGSLTQSMMEDGFLSRFSVVEYNGPRPPLNPEPLLVPDDALTAALAEIANYVATKNPGLMAGTTQLVPDTHFTLVGRDAEAAELLDAFDKKCDAEINGSEDESHRQMWNRAGLKVMRIAALLAVADNHLHPVIQRAHVEWALELGRRDIALMTSRIKSGDIGAGDDARQRKILSIIRGYLTKGVGSSYGVPAAMQDAGIIPRKYLQTRTAQIGAFYTAKVGSSAALDMTLKSMVDSGYLMEMEKVKMVEKYKFHGKCFQVLDLPEEE